MRVIYSLSGALLASVVMATALPAQKLHVNNKWDNCAIVLDPSLTQAAFHQFVGEVGLVVYFRPLESARPIGRGRVEVALLNSGTRIDPKDAAWNDTFSHPDSVHWLMEGDALMIPAVMLRVGVTDRVDVGTYFTKSMGANYGMVGGQLQYTFAEDAKHNLTAAGRVSAVQLLGPDDVSAGVYGLDVLVSKNLRWVAPYAGVSTYLSHGHEKTTKVNLADENVFGVQGMVGIAAHISAVRLGAEFNMARVPGYSLKVGFGL